jgi:hypothetical protein
MPVFAFDIETIPDGLFRRRMFDLGDLTDKQVGHAGEAPKMPGMSSCHTSSIESS